jgi:uncharacterized protein (DUF58 family)
MKFIKYRKTRLSVTREGRSFLFAVFVIAFAALNTGNNLIYLIFSMLLSYLILSLLLPWFNLRKLDVTFHVDEPVYAATPHPVRIVVENRKKRLASYSLRLRIAAGEGFHYIKIVPAGGVGREIFKTVFQHRGVYPLAGASMATSFPFIFFTLAMPTASSLKKVLVYPRVYDVSGRLHGATSGKSAALGTGDDFHKLRRYAYGDPPRDIHWKATARTGTVMVKEFLGEEPRRATVVLDDAGYGTNEDFEKAVSFTASVLWHLTASSTAVRLVTGQKTVPFGIGMEHLYGMLDVLSVIAAGGGTADGGGMSEPLQEGEADILVMTDAASPFARYATSAGRVFYAQGL